METSRRESVGETRAGIPDGVGLDGYESNMEEKNSDTIQNTVADVINIIDLVNEDIEDTENIDRNTAEPAMSSRLSNVDIEEDTDGTPRRLRRVVGCPITALNYRGR